jgi:hypothetical protein
MLFTIVMSVCMLTNAATCREERIDIRGPAMACLVQAQPAVAEWSGDHPDWKVERWKCRPS